MMRVIRFALVWMTALTAATGTAQAQPPAPPEEGRFSALVTMAATLGNKSDKSVGVDLGYRAAESFEVFLEAGRMGNVATSDLDARAQRIANFINGSASTAQKATYFDIGVKYRGPLLMQRLRPYIGFGIGGAKVKTEVNFAVNGTDVTSDLEGRYGILLGADLTDSLTKTFITIPLGVQYTFLKRYLVDGSYRYGRISARPDDIDQDVAISAQRVQIGVGVRF